jgi:hypothetical protein
LYRAGSVKTVSEVPSKYKLDLVRVQEVRWEGSGTETVDKYIYVYLSCGKGNENHELGTGFLCIRESYQQFRELIVCVIGCHT